MARLLKTYPSFSRDWILDTLPSVEGWVYYNWALENDAWLQFAGIKRKSKGYVAQQADELVNVAVEYYRSNGR